MCSRRQFWMKLAFPAPFSLVHFFWTNKRNEQFKLIKVFRILGNAGYKSRQSMQPQDLPSLTLRQTKQASSQQDYYQDQLLIQIKEYFYASK